jgi:hypothetical protein
MESGSYTVVSRDTNQKEHYREHYCREQVIRDESKREQMSGSWI